MRKLVISVILCAGLSGLSFAAKEKGPMATVNMQKGYDKGAGLGAGTAQFYDYAPDNRCSGRKRLYKFSLITGSKASKPIPAGQKIVISAYANRYTSGGSAGATPGVTLNTATCENRMEFTPIAGEMYDVFQRVEVAKSCRLSIVVSRTGEPPNDLLELDPASCTQRSR